MNCDPSVVFARLLGPATTARRWTVDRPAGRPSPCFAPSTISRADPWMDEDDAASCPARPHARLHARPHARAPPAQQPPLTLLAAWSPRRRRRRVHGWWRCRTRLPAAAGSDRDSRRLIALAGPAGRPARIDGHAAVRVPAAARDDAPVPTRPAGDSGESRWITGAYVSFLYS